MLKNFKLIFTGRLFTAWCIAYTHLCSLTLFHNGGTLPSNMHENVSSNADDITTKPLIPLARSCKEVLIVCNKLL